MTLLGIDWGQKRVGLALANSQARLASPLMSVSNNEGLYGQLQRVCQEHAVGQIVVGLPRNLEGEETAQSAQVRAFAKALGARLQLPVALQDESLTSVAAKKATDIDAGAASIILQDYLESL